MFGLEPEILLLLGICLLAAAAFEFVNGFHDTANAVATVIYTNTLRPWVAVVWSGIWNFLGVFAGGIAVAMGVVYLLPVETLIDQNVYHSVAMVGALLLSAIIWNLGTWWYGLPASSSHTLIGSILGVGIAFSLLPGSTGAAVNWGKAGEIGLSLLISPLFGFTATILLMFLLRRFVDNKKIFEEPPKKKAPPTWLRLILIFTCTGVSFFHGSNDGQKGVGLIMLILIGIVPAQFALNVKKDPIELRQSLTQLETNLNQIVPNDLSAKDRTQLAESKRLAADLHQVLQTSPGTDVHQLAIKDRFQVRKDILLLTKTLDKLKKTHEITEPQHKAIESSIAGMKTFTDYAPFWVLLMVSTSLGLGTMIGWKRIVKTVGEKIGKEHLTYAQGASAELVAASTIGLSTYLGLPVSTTHVLSSGIAGSMVANRGIKNLQAKTVRNIALAWVLTLPVSMTLSGVIFLLLRAVL
jgi:phosphate/sulfate permease